MFGNKQPAPPKPMPKWLKWGVAAFIIGALAMRMSGVQQPMAHSGQRVQQVPQHADEPHWDVPSIESYKEQLIPGYGRLQMADSAPGSGTGAICGQEVSIRYGEEPVATRPGAKKPPAPEMKPLTFRLGSKDVPAVLQETVTGMRVGGKRQSIVPPERSGNGVAYRYVVEMLKAQPELGPAARGHLGMRVFDRTTGIARLVSCGDTVTANLTIWDMEGRKLLDTHEKRWLVSLPLGSGSFMAGLEAGIPGMRADGSRTLLIPPALQKPLRAPAKSDTSQPDPLSGLKLPEGQFIVVDVDLVP